MSSFDVGMSGSGGPADRWGHWGPQLVIGAILCTIALALRPIPPGSPGATVVPALLVGAVLASWLLMRHHDRRLCERCVASMPLNASESAVRLRRRLALVHRAQDRRLLVGYLAVLVLSNLLLVDARLLPAHLAPLLWAAVQATMVYPVLCYSSHRRLQPWCPGCQGGGGEHRGSFDPQPTGSLGT